MVPNRRAIFAFACLLVLSVGGVITARASTSNGTIDPNGQNYKYGWGDVVSWVNFGTSGGNVHVLDDRLTGYAWSENFGWINMSSTRAAVTNNAEGTLGGYAWGENFGYIPFTGVTIDSSGVFHGTTGQATSTNAGSISFDCTNCRVVTDWRPASTRTSTSTSGGGGGGGGPSGGAFEKPKQPLAIVINNGSIYTTTPQVVLSLFAGDNVKSMALSNYLDFSIVGQEPYIATRAWNLCAPAQGNGPTDCPEGMYIVYAKYYTQYGQSSDPVYDTIIYKKQLTPPEQIENNQASSTYTATIAQQGSLFNFIQKTIDFFTPEFLKRKPTPVPAPIVIPKEAPLSFRSAWELLPKPAIQRYVFSPLSKQVFALTQELPTLGNIFNNTGITRTSELTKLRGVQLVLPGLSKTIAIRSGAISGAPLAGGTVKTPTLQTPAFGRPGVLYKTISVAKLPSFAGIPIASLPASLKSKIPQEVVFARTANQKIDLDVSVALNTTGQLTQTIKTVSGQTLDLFVRPVAPANKVVGYMVLRDRTGRSVGASNQKNDSIAQKEANNFKFSLASLPDSLFFGNPSPATRSTSIEDVQASLDKSVTPELLANAGLPADIDRKFVVSAFEYDDSNSDGIYEAHVQAPVVDGSYDILTLISYKDPDLGVRQIALTAVIDPEGYVYESFAGRELRITAATVSLYTQTADGSYKLWPADDYSQQNPQITDRRGSYAFLVPDGSYYIAVSADGYQDYQSKPFTVHQGDSGIHMNLQLTPVNSVWQWLDWKAILLIIIILLLVHHLYLDRYRSRIAQPQQTPAKPTQTPLLPPLP